VTGTNACLQISSCCVEVQNVTASVKLSQLGESSFLQYATLHAVTAGLTLHRCFCVTHTALLLMHDSYYITVTV
jgi:hypothetical protein